MLPIAATNMPSAMYTPLVVLIVAYVALSLLAARARGHEDRAQAERYSGIAFALVLVAAAYVVVLLIATVFSYPSRFYDMLVIIVVVGAFFAVLLFVFLLLTEVLPGALRRGRDR
jgi:cobalamin biosynthesis protein CobD/CbiB